MNTTPIEFMSYDSVLNAILKPKILQGNCFSKSNKFMQLTALRSINNEPIYNHMIVKNDIFGHALVDMFNYTKMYILSMYELEIVGNRFQHPHLLELCK